MTSPLMVQLFGLFDLPELYDRNARPNKHSSAGSLLFTQLLLPSSPTQFWIKWQLLPRAVAESELVSTTYTYICSSSSLPHYSQLGRYLLIRVGRERCQPEMKREKPITVKGLLDNGSRLSPPNNDDYMEREQELTSTGTVYLIS